MHPKSTPNIVCEQCGKAFYVRPSHLSTRRYCSRACKDASQRRPDSITPADIERFWSKVDRAGGPDACWEWRGRRDAHGYGSFDYKRGTRNIGAHRFAWIVTNGDIPDGLETCHDCPGGDNPSCCNPAHLFLGTHAENVQDMWAKGRGRPTGPIGERAPQSVLTEALVMEARQRYVDTDYPLWRMAKEYGITRKGLVLAINGTNWSHLPQPEPTVSPEEVERIRAIRAFNERPIRSKLSEADVKSIRRLYAAGGVSMAALGRRYGVTATTVQNIVHRRIWKNIP